MFRYTQEVGKTNGIDIDMNTGTGWPFGGPEVSLSQAAAKAIFECYEVKGGESVKLEIDIRDPKEEKQRDVAYLDCLMAYGADGKMVNLTRNGSWWHCLWDGLFRK